MRDKLFTRNFTFSDSGAGQFSDWQLHPKVCPLHVCAGADRIGIHFCNFVGRGHAAYHPVVPFGGILADRANRRNIMVGLDTLSGCTVLVAGLVLPFGHDIWVIGALLVILSVLAAFESPTVQACIPQMLSGDNLMKGNAAVNQVQAIAGLITPFLGSLVYAAFGLTPGPLGNGGLLFPHRYFGVLHSPGLSKGGSHYECPGDH